MGEYVTFIENYEYQTFRGKDELLEEKLSHLEGGKD